MSIKDEEARISSTPIVVYGKGTKLMPMCGFTGKVVEIFRHIGKPFSVVNILEDDNLRQGMKEFSEWPTFPQVYVDGEFVGGADIVIEMFDSGELQSLVENHSE